MIIALCSMSDMFHTPREYVHYSKNGAQSSFCCGDWDLAAEYHHVIKEEKASFGLRWLYKQAANCYSWLFMRDHKSQQIRAAKVPEK